MAKVVSHLLLVGLLLVTLRLSAQEGLGRRISLEVVSVSGVELLDELQLVTQQTFSYNPTILPVGPFTQSWQDVPVQQILEQTIGSDFRYKQRGTYIIIQAPKTTQKQTFEFKGTIVDEATGSQISNVSVFEANTLTASLSDDQGKYNVKVASKYDEATFVISKQNYQDTVVRVQKGQGFPAQIELKPAPPQDPGEVKIDGSNFFKLVVAQKIRQHLANVQLGEKRPFQISLLPAVGTNGLLSGKITNTVSLNILAGLAYGVEGVELGGAINLIRQEVKGIQGAGAANYVGGNIEGVQAAGAVNVTLGNTTGAQMAGALNVNIGNITGTQMAGGLNQSGDMTGFQGAGALNWAGGVTGVQASGGFNYAHRDVKGAMLTAGMNYARTHVRGLQVSLFNYTYTLSGVQIGLVNVVNDSRKSVSIGLINIVKNGIKKLELSHDDATDFNLSFRMGTKAFYTIYLAGIHNRDFDHWNFGLGVGSQLDIRPKFFGNIELASLALVPMGENIALDYTLSKINLSLGYSFAKHLSLVLGPQLNIYVRDRNTEDLFQIEPDNLWHESDDVSIWLGYKVGVRF
ncbi:MAG: hypothetical protein AAGA85_05575 [Bacteroidota bacterium]